MTQAVIAAKAEKAAITLQKKIEFIGPKRQRKEREKIDQWIVTNQEKCLFCAEPLLKQNHKDSVKDYCHITVMYCGAGTRHAI